MSTTLRAACLTALLALYGCGGGGGSDGTTPPVIVPAVELTLSGTVTDAAVPNATVTVHVGSDSFDAAAMTDADGAFSVDIESADDDALVTLEAVDATTGVHFMSVPTTFGALNAQADADGGVAGLSITNVTTAHYVLALRSTSDGDFDDIDELASVAPSVDSSELLELAAAIKTVVENRDGVTLPDGVSDTLELANAIADGSSTFLDDVEASSPGTLDEAAADVLDDGNATVPFTADAAGVYVDATADVTLALVEGGLGWMNSGGDIRTIGSWHVDDAGKISILFPAADHEVNSLTLLGQAGGFDSVVTDVSTLTDSASQGMEFATYQHSAIGDGFASADVADGTFVLADDEATALVFLADGSGYNADASSGAQEDAFHWQVLDDGRLLLEYDGAVVTVYRVTDDAGSVLVVRTDAGGAASAVGLTQLTAAD